MTAWSRRPAVQDAGLAAALFLVCLLVNGSDPVMPLDGLPTDDDRIALWWAATALVVASVALRRRWALPMLVVCVLSVATHLALSFPFLVIDLGVLIPMYTVATRHRRTVSLAVLACVLLLAAGWSLYWVVNVHPEPGLPDVVHAVIPPPVPGLPDRPPKPGPRAVVVEQSLWEVTWNGIAVLSSALVASWAVGAGARSHRRYLDGLRARADALELERDQQAALAVAAERGRISRELHDVVAHGLSVMVIQAQGGAAALDNRPADTRVALDAIVRTGRDSLADMRRVLAAVGTAEDAWHPPPGLGQLTTLLAEVRKAGTPVRLQVDGAAATLPSTVDLSAYRIVQEALTNTMKHAGTGARAEVRLSYGRAEVGIEVGDDGRGVVGHGGGGNGLRGMRERAKLLGGSLVAGPGPEGGFLVRATLPIRGHDR
jgi:signal transduction histidine kinase